MILHNLNRKQLISFIEFILKYPESKESRIKAELIKKELGTASDDFFDFQEDFTIVHIHKILAYILSLEVFNIQSGSIKQTLEYLIKKHFEDKMSFAELFTPTLSIQDIQNKHNNLIKELDEFQQKNIKYKRLKSMNRNSFEYNKIMDYKYFELNNNFAFECAKRKFPILYLVELNYCSRIAENFFTHVGASFIKECINEREHFDAGIITAHCYKEVLDQLFDTIKEGKSFFNLFDRYYETEYTKLNEEEFDAHVKDFEPYYRNNPEFYDDKITRVLHTFRSPRLINSKKWEADIRLNLALPTDQLVDYIKHVKRTLAVVTTRRADGSLVDNIMPDTAADKMFTIYHKNIRSKREIRKTFGDIMFTYDCILEGINHKTIAQKLNQHREETNEKTLTEKTMLDLVSVYAEIAHTLIQEMRFLNTRNEIFKSN